MGPESACAGLRRRAAEDPAAARAYMRRAALLDSLREADAVQ